MYAHLYTLTYSDYAEPAECWFVRTNGTEPRALGTIFTDLDQETFTAKTTSRHDAGTTTNLIAAADLLYQVDRAMSNQPTKPEHDQTAHNVAALEYEATR